MIVLWQVRAVHEMTFRLSDYLPILLMFIVAGGFAVGNILLSQFVGQRKRTRTKLMPYECGKDPVGSARERFSVKFYLIAMIFILFDIEVIFLVPWAVVAKSIGAQVGRTLLDEKPNRRMADPAAAPRRVRRLDREPAARPTPVRAG
jgi:NADH-quinone oxidoreductase subunit A